MPKTQIYPFIDNGNGVYRPLVPIRIINPLDNTNMLVYGIVGVSPALDTLIILFLAPLFMIVDLIVTYIQFRKDKN